MGTTSAPIEIFRTGRHTAMSGAALNFSEADLQAAAAAYDPAVHEAPLVVGHPKDNGPAYGWVQGLAFAEGVLRAEPAQVDPAFAELVNAGRFKKVSASFYTPDSAANPKPGTYYLRHVGFLGAQPPAVKGLKSASFGEAEDGVVEFADWADMQNAGLWARLREFIVDQFGLEKADLVIPSFAVDSLKEAARAEPAETASANPAYAEGNAASGQVSTPVSNPAANPQETSMTQSASATQVADFAEREATLAAQAADLAKREKALRHTELMAFADGLVQQGRLLPALKDKAVAFAESLPTDAVVVEFGEGDKQTETPAVEVFKSFLAAQPVLVSYGEVAGAARDAGNGASSGMSDRQVADRARIYKDKQAQAGNHLSFAEAVDAVNAGQDKE